MIGNKYNNQICWNCQYRWVNQDSGAGWCYMFQEKHDLLKVARCGQYAEGKAMIVTGLHLKRQQGAANG